MKELTMNVLTKLFNKSEDELGKLIFDGEEIKDGAFEALVALDAERISRVKKEATGDTTKKFDDGYKKATKEVMKKFENDFKEATGFESDLNGMDLILKWSEGLSENDTITADTIKKHPEFLKIESQWKESKNADINDLQKQFNDFKTGVEREKVMGAIRATAKSEFLKLNPVLSQDPSRAEAQTNMFLQRFNSYGYETTEDGNVVIMDGDKRMEDKHGHPVEFASFVKGQAEQVFDFQVQKDRKSPGNTPSPGGAGKVKLSKEEWNKKINETEGDPEAMKELSDKYERAV